MGLLPGVGRIALGVGVYLATALASVWVVRRHGGDLKEMSGRSEGVIPIVGAVANLVVFGVVLALFVDLDGRPLSALGLGLGPRGAAAIVASSALTLGPALAFVRWVARRRGARVERVPFTRELRLSLTRTALLLLAVSAQEEVLFRGYVVANLAALGLGLIIVVSTLVFVLIHLVTNRGGLAQLVSWTLGGILLIAAYLVSGSIWVAIAVHFITDLTNVLVFDVAGKGSVIRFEPKLTTADRAWFRLMQSALVVGALVTIYGPRLTVPSA